MLMKFNFNDVVYDVEADEPYMEYDAIEIQRPKVLTQIPGKIFPRWVAPKPDKILGRGTLNPITIRFHNNDSANSEIIKQMEKQMTYINNMPIDGCTVYKFNSLLYNEKREWDLMGCFIVSYTHDPDTNDMDVTLSVDHIPNRVDNNIEELKASGKYE